MDMDIDIDMHMCMHIHMLGTCNTAERVVSEAAPQLTSEES